MGNLDPGAQLQLAVALGIACVIVFLADLAILFLWLRYKIAVSHAQQFTPFPMPNPVETESGLAAPSPSSLPIPEVVPGYALPVEAPMEEQTATAPMEPEPLPQEQTALLTSLPYYPPAPEIKPPFAPTWSVVHAFVCFQVVFLAAQLASVIFLLPAIWPVLTRLDKWQEAMFSSLGVAGIIATLVLQNGLFVAGTAFCVRRYGTNLKEIGLRMPTQKEILLGVGLGAALFLLSALGEQGVGEALKHLSPKLAASLAKTTEALTAGGIFEQIHSNGLKLAFVLAGAVAAPIGEEVFFRGFLYNALKKRWGVPAGIIISGLAFALIHIGPLAMVIIFPMGMILAYVYERTRSLWVTILMHIMNNGVALLLIWFLPQLGK